MAFLEHLMFGRRNARLWRYVSIPVTAILLAGCSGPEAPRPAPQADQPQAQQESPPAQAEQFAGPRKIEDAPGIHNLVQASPRIFTGSEPHGEEGFASLARLGVKTVVSVDGAKPDVEMAGRHGLRYVHIPIGYDGVPKKAGESLARLVREVEGPIYVHCHHGQHRGPAAAAVACLADAAVTAEQAAEILETAGTAKSYPGLWRDVAAYAPPPQDAALPDLVEVAEVESFAAAMAKIDRNFDNLKLCQKAGWTVPPDHPDIVPVQESLILKEGLRESLRNLVADRPEEFKAWLKESADLSESLEVALMRNDTAQAAAAMTQLEQSCKKCHGKYRNSPVE